MSLSCALLFSPIACDSFYLPDGRVVLSLSRWKVAHLPVSAADKQCARVLSHSLVCPLAQLFQNMYMKLAKLFCFLAKIWLYMQSRADAVLSSCTNDIDFYHDSAQSHMVKKHKRLWPNVMRRIAPSSRPEHRCLVLLLWAGNFCNIHRTKTTSSANPVVACVHQM